MLTSRVLPAEEWQKVADREPYCQIGLPDPTHWMIVVVEDAGSVVASCALLDSVHWDGFAVDPDHRGNPSVFGKLLECSIRTLQQAGVTGVHITVPDNQPELESMVERFGFVQAPGRLFLLSVPPQR